MSFYDRNGKKVYYQRLDPSILDKPAVRKFLFIKQLIFAINIAITATVILLLYMGVI